MCGFYLYSLLNSSNAVYKLYTHLSNEHSTHAALHTKTLLGSWRKKGIIYIPSLDYSGNVERLSFKMESGHAIEPIFTKNTMGLLLITS